MPPSSLWHSWQATVSARPHALAVIDAHDGREWTRAQLQAAAEEMAAGAPGTFTGGEAVAFGEPNGARWLAVFLALQKIGAAALPLDTSLPPGRRPEAAEELGARWFLDAAGHWRELIPSAAISAPDRDVCLLKITSGSTGQPRALAFTADNMLADGRQIAATMGITPDDRNLGAIPFGHSYGLGNLVMLLIAQGTAVVASVEILPDALAAQIEGYGATVLPSVPVVLRGLAESSVDPGRLRSLRRVVSAGAALRAEVAAGFREKFGCPIQNFYGSSETGGICFDRTGEATISGRSVGQPMEGVTVDLDDQGRVTVRSAAVVAPGEHTLADLGAWNTQGELVLAGRSTALANIGGRKVSPLEIERVLRGLDGVSDAWVGVRARRSGEGDFLLAAVETARPREEVRRALAERLPNWQVPHHLWVTPGFPRTDRGKLDRRVMELRCAGEAEGAG